VGRAPFGAEARERIGGREMSVRTPSGGRRPGAAVVCATLALTPCWLVGCGKSDKTTSATTTPPKETTTAPEPDASGGSVTIPDTPETDATLGESTAQVDTDRVAREQKVLNDAQAVGALLNDYWSGELQAQYSLAFDQPDRFVYYRGEETTSCGEYTGPRARNAYYCPYDVNEHVAFDLDWLQEYLVSHPGGATTFLVLAHEWGHAVQDTWLENNGNDVWDPASRKELNADCLAGVFLAAAINQGAIVEEVGDAESIFRWLAEAGDTPWTSSDFHGTAAERQAAFGDGYTRGTDYCRQTY
jgi:predicted metalloprotease